MCLIVGSKCCYLNPVHVLILWSDAWTLAHTHTQKSWLAVQGFKKCDARPHNGYAQPQSWSAKPQDLSAQALRLGLAFDQL